MFKNKLFKARLKDTLVAIVVTVIVLLAIAAIGAASMLIMYGLQKLWGPLDDIVFFGIGGSYILYQLWKGLKWLFIEPFKKSADEASEAAVVMGENDTDRYVDLDK